MTAANSVLVSRLTVVALAASALAVTGAGVGTAASRIRAARAQTCPDGVTGELRDGVLLCVHGDEPPPPGVDARRRPTTDELRGRRLGRGERLRADPNVAATTSGLATAESGTGYRIACVGDGVSGPRVQAIYAVAVDVPDRSAELVPLIRQYAADADLRVNRSAGVQGAGRRVRYVTSPSPGGGCAVDVRVVRLSATGDDTFAAMRSELRAQGLSRTDRKYLVWADAAVGICGLGEVFQDDRPTADNRNNSGPMYARADAPCWGYAETHELLHTLGAVQAGAPNATPGGHCTDDNDVMCYADASGVVLKSVCPTTPVQYVDCGLDDYFAPNPAAGTYVANRWNVARSVFLEPAGPPPPAPGIVVSAPASMQAGGTVSVSATVTLPAGRTGTVTWSASRGDCRFGSPNAATTTFSCPATAAGDVQVAAAVVDDLGLAASNVAAVSLAPPASPRATTITSAVSMSRVTFGGSLQISGSLTDSASLRPVFGMPVTAFALTNGTTTYRQVGSGVTDVAGRVALTIQPATSSTIVLVSSSTPTWQQAQSPGQAVAVVPIVRATPSSTSITLGSTLRVAVSIDPDQGGIGVRLRRVTSTGTLTTVASSTTTTSGTATLSYKPTARGTYTLRVVLAADADHASASAPGFTLTIR